MTPTDRSAAETIRLLNAENRELADTIRWHIDVHGADIRHIEERDAKIEALLARVVELEAALQRADDEIERCIADRELMRDERDVARASGSIW